MRRIDDETGNWMTNFLFHKKIKRTNTSTLTISVHKCLLLFLTDIISCTPIRVDDCSMFMYSDCREWWSWQTERIRTWATYMQPLYMYVYEYKFKKKNILWQWVHCSLFYLLIIIISLSFLYVAFFVFRFFSIVWLFAPSVCCILACWSLRMNVSVLFWGYWTLKCSTRNNVSDTSMNSICVVVFFHQHKSCLCNQQKINASTN